MMKTWKIFKDFNKRILLKSAWKNQFQRWEKACQLFMIIGGIVSINIIKGDLVLGCIGAAIVLCVEVIGCVLSNQKDRS